MKIAKKRFPFSLPLHLMSIHAIQDNAPEYRTFRKNPASFTISGNRIIEKLACRTDTGKPGHIRGTMEQETNGRTVLVYDMVDNHVRILRILFPELLK